MIEYKSQDEIEKLREGGKLLAKIVDQLAKKVRPGIGTAELEKLAAKLVKKNKAKPAFLGYQGFPCIICASVNQEIVHGFSVPNRILKEGDIFSIDMGLEFKGLITDMAVTVPVGNVSSVAQKLIDVTKKCLDLSINEYKV